jgi:hypothetical protein
LLIILLTLARTSKVFAHCDTLDGPVIAAAKNALETGDVNLVLYLGTRARRRGNKATFQKTLIVRKHSPVAKELVDMYFFKTLVRIRRAGECSPYTGLKPAVIDLGQLYLLLTKQSRQTQLSLCRSF